MQINKLKTLFRSNGATAPVAVAEASPPAPMPELIGPARATGALDRMSGRYEFVSTERIHHELINNGYELKRQHAAHVRSRGREGWQAHILLYELPHTGTKEGNLQLVVRNSHDGSCALELFHGYFRVYCSNQLYRLSASDAHTVRLMHRDYNRTALQDAVHLAMDRVGQFNKEMNQLRQTTWSRRQIERYAERVLSLRYATRIPNIPLSVLNEVRRPEDEGNSAWLVMNRMQEVLVGGNIRYQEGDESRLIRPLTAVSRVPEYNSAIWESALALG